MTAEPSQPEAAQESGEDAFEPKGASTGLSVQDVYSKTRRRSK